MFKLLPKEDKFYRMMQEIGQHANASARHLKVLVESTDDETIKAAAKAISTHKSEAKKIIATLTEEACRTLITPFDREDMQEFAGELYDVPKHIEKVKDRMLRHNLQDFNGDFSRFATVIERCADSMDTILTELSGKLNTKTMNAKAAVMHELEDQGDEILGQNIADSFYSIQDVRELILRKDLYEMMEEITDLYRDAANVALRIVLKHS